MYLVEEKRILYVEDGTTDYVFHCFQPTVGFNDLRSCIFLDEAYSLSATRSTQWNKKNLSETKKEELLWDEYERVIIPRIEKGENIYLAGAFSKKIYDHVRAFYKERGWYDQNTGTYVPDRVNPGISLTVNIFDLVYRSSKFSTRYLSQWAVRSAIAALNDGIISRVYIRLADEPLLVEYFEQSHLALAKIAEAITTAWKDSSENCSFFTLKVPSPLSTEAPIE